jgi:hypothetical protein
MSIIREWAAQHMVPFAAVLELERRMGLAARDLHAAAFEDGARPSKPGSEAYQQDLVRLEAAQKDIKLFRNNVGALKDKDGRLVRFGLANDNAAINKVLKSSDLIGWRKRIITPQMVGQHIAQFTAREMKPEDWTYSGDEHEAAQLAFIELGLADGADMAFATGPGTL